ncbi:MAG TPA: type I CRISPR-associated protein Cas7 [Magnetospirillum sp.]|nr:type I CRISPR-associated protein Cas7 [Magnetospirillum sp.]
MDHLNRGTGLLIIEARLSNPNGDPDMESDPRVLESDGRGLISPVSVKRKLRDLIDHKDGDLWRLAAAALDLQAEQYRILEARGRDRKEIEKMPAEQFRQAFWDARVFGNTFLESMKARENKQPVDHFIRTGVVQFGPGISIAPIEIERLTLTNKAGVQEGKDRGMAPLAWRVVRHAVYAMPFFVNPMEARKTGCAGRDIDLLRFLIPHAYSQTASNVRPFVVIRHAWYATHKSPLGSCPDHRIIDAMMPRKVKGEPDQPSLSIDEYDIPTVLPEDIEARLQSFDDLCMEVWEPALA